jgi:Uma2 family endonuclease
MSASTKSRRRAIASPPFHRFIAIEILSPPDRVSRVRKKIDEYLAFGVSYVWLIDPERRRADVYTASLIYEAKDGVLRTEDPAIEVPPSRPVPGAG